MGVYWEILHHFVPEFVQKRWNDRGEFELDRARSKNNIAENSVALGHDTHNNWSIFGFVFLCSALHAKLYVCIKFMNVLYVLYFSNCLLSLLILLYSLFGLYGELSGVYVVSSAIHHSISVMQSVSTAWVLVYLCTNIYHSNFSVKHCMGSTFLILINCLPE